MILVNESLFFWSLEDQPLDLCFENNFIIYITTITWSKKIFYFLGVVIDSCLLGIINIIVIYQSNLTLGLKLPLLKTNIFCFKWLL